MRINFLRGPRLASNRGTSLLDVLVVLTVIGIAGGIAIPRVSHAVADVRELGSARAFAMRVRQLRTEAVRRTATVGWRFTRGEGATHADDAMAFRAYLDGNGNGLRIREIDNGVDPPLGAPATFADGLRGVRFGLRPAVPLAGDEAEGSAGGSEPAGGASDGDASGSHHDESDPIRMGTTDLLSFSPAGTGTSGTIYLRGPTRQFAVRVYGPTGRIRLLEYRRELRAWIER